VNITESARVYRAQLAALPDADLLRAAEAVEVPGDLRDVREADKQAWLIAVSDEVRARGGWLNTRGVRNHAHLPAA
jgi:hypothetical protein